VKKGKVYLVGAGPGDPGLLTIRGREVLERAEVVIYDYLANEEFLKYAPASAERIYVGKKGGDHTLSQDGINALLVEKGRENVVVRLKGGDPFIFGRGGEEAQVLVETGIPFEVVPGISATA
jgi:uroporphyrinogen III methyltransferase/synthase